MGFLDKLQDYGIGTRGPYGRQLSGAQRLTGALDRQVESALDKAIIAMGSDPSGGYKEITPQQQIELADRWGRSLNEVAARVKPHNQRVVENNIKTKSQLAYKLALKFKDEGEEMNTKTARKIFEKAEIRTPDEIAGAVRMFQMVTNRKGMKSTAGGYVETETDPLGNTIGGNVVHTIPKTEPKTKPKETADIINYKFAQQNPEFKKWMKSKSVPKDKDFAKNIFIASQAAQIDPKKVVAGNLTPEEADKLADKYAEKFGAMNLFRMLLNLSGQSSIEPIIEFDAKGNMITK